MGTWSRVAISFAFSKELKLGGTWDLQSFG